MAVSSSHLYSGNMYGSMLYVDDRRSASLALESGFLLTCTRGVETSGSVAAFGRY